MNIKKFILLQLFFFLAIAIVNGQEQIIIKGKIIDAETNKPIEGVSVEIGKWNKGDRTNSKGLYEIKLPKEGIDTNDKFKVYAYKNDAYQESETVFYTTNPIILNFSLKKREYDKFKYDYQTQIYKIRYRNPIEIFNLLKPFLSKNDKGTESSFSNELKTITIKDRTEVIKELRELINRYDIPLKNIWMKVTIIKASKNGQKQKDFPKDIENVIKKLNSLFNFDKYEIVGWGDAMGVEGSHLRFSASNIVEPLNGTFSAKVRLGYFENIIKLEDFAVSMPSGNDLVTTINVKNGETVVVGASRTNKIKQSSLITVVTAKVIE